MEILTTGVSGILSYTPMYARPAVDFDEELSGLYGGALYEESEYVIICIKYLYELYKLADKV